MSMTKNINKILTIMLCTVATSSYAEQTDSNIALGIKAGTQGMGIEGRVPLAPNLYARVGGNFLQLSHTLSNTDLALTAKLKFFTIPVMLDFHPAGNSGFRISIGVAYNDNKVIGRAHANQPITLYGHNYSPQQIGTVHANLKLGNKIGGIASIGYDNSLTDNNIMSFNTELGVMYAGEPKLKITFTGLGRNAAPDINRKINSKLQKYKKYLKLFPIFSLGIKVNL